MTSKLEAALALAARGFKVFPLKAGAKAPPLVKDWPAKATTDQDQVTRWWMGGVESNIGIHCDGLLVIDVDVKKGGDRSLAKLEMFDGLDTQTLTTNTPSGGRHLFYRCPAPVPNGVDVLGPGLDIRSSGGYVVGPGSSVPAGDYAFQDEAVAIAEAPDWLVQKLGVSTKRERPVELNIPDAPDDVVARATAWLKTAERSIKGAGGDQAAYRVACQLRDIGVSEAQARELMRSETWDYGCGWRDGWLEAKPIASAYRYATGEPGSKSVTADAFEAADGPILGSIYTSQNEAKRPAFLSSEDYLRERGDPAEYIIKGLLYRRSYAALVAPPAAGKTFVALDWAWAVAQGEEWYGRRVKAGTVLYLPYEGKGGLPKRLRALRQVKGPAPNLMVVDKGYNFREPSEQGAFRREVLDQLPEKPSLIIIDTYAHALMGGDENSAQDVGDFNRAMQALIQATGACVLILHHPTKNGTSARGSGALLGAVDAEIQIEERQIIPRKLRDDDLGSPMGFDLRVVPLGTDADGDPITSCVLVPGVSRPAGVKLVKGAAALAFDALCRLSPDNAPVHRDKWCKACVDDFLADNAHPKQRMAEYRKTLRLAGKIVEGEDGMVTRRLE